MANLKPILEELKNLKENINSDAIRNLVLSNLNDNREKIELKIKNLAETTKNNPVVTEYVDQILRAELTNQAMDQLQTRFPDHDIVKKIVDLRLSFIQEEVVETPVKEEAPVEEKVEAKTEEAPTPKKEEASEEKMQTAAEVLAGISDDDEIEEEQAATETKEEEK